ncbi:MAG: hypothetical protein QXH80_03785 [Candidatus Nanoarchaeia archaeon]
MATKEYISERIAEAVSMSKKAREMLHHVWNAQLDIIRDDKEIVEREEHMLAELRKLDDDLKAVETQGKVLEEAVRTKAAELVRGICDNIKERVAHVIKEIESIASKQHAFEEKKRSEAKKIQKEWKETVGAEEFILHLKELEESIARLASGFISKAKRRQVKL